MRIEKIQDNISLLENLNKGDIMIISKSSYAANIQISPENIFWVEYADKKGVSLKRFSKNDIFLSYEELKADHYWYLVRLTLYLN
jgi:hypothetical protein